MYEIFGLNFFSGSITEVTDRVAAWVRSNKHTYICVTGAHGVVETSRTPAVLLAHRKAGLVVPDGMPLVWIGKIMGFSKTQRIYGPDLFLALCKKAETEKLRVFFYGCTTQVLAALLQRLHERFPKLIIAGSYAPPFCALTKKESREIVHTINTSRAQIVFVGLSTPKQELWMQDFSRKLHANALMGIGAAFDFVAGTKKQAPRWVQQTGFEWLFRLLQEPKRLWYRSIVVNSRFIFFVMKHIHMRWFTRAMGTMVLQGVLYVLMTGLLLGITELAARVATDKGFVSYYRPIQIQTRIDLSAKAEDWRLTHMYKDEQFVPDPLLFWKPKPRSWRYNEDGFVGNVDRSALREAKERGGCSILAIGDSNTQGITEFSWPERLNEIFVTKGLATRVVNAGVAGYSSYQGVQFLRQEVPRIAPDIVLVSFGWNDMTPDMGMPDRNFPRFSLPANSVLNRSKLYLVIRNIFSPKVHNDGEYHPRVSLSEYRENLNAIITTTQQHKSSALLLTRPYNPEHMVWNSVSPLLKGGWRKYVYDYNDVVRDLAEERSVPLLDMEAQFSTKAAYFLDDSHFTLEASRLAAAYIFEWLDQKITCK